MADHPTWLYCVAGVMIWVSGMMTGCDLQKQRAEAESWQEFHVKQTVTDLPCQVMRNGKGCGAALLTIQAGSVIRVQVMRSEGEKKKSKTYVGIKPKGEAGG